MATRQQIREILLKQGFTAETVEHILNGEVEKTSVLAVNDPLRVTLEGDLQEVEEALYELESEVMADDEEAGYAVAEALRAAEIAGEPTEPQPPLDPSFSQETCPTCNDQKTQKTAAVEASQKAEMILVIRDIVGRFKRQTDSQLTALSNKVTSHLNTIVAASNDLTVTKHDLDLSLLRLEEDLKDAFGIKDMLDPNWAGNAMFLEDEEGEPLDLFEAPAPGTDAVFDKLSADVDAALTLNDPDDIEPGAQTDRRPFKAGDQAYN
jgi:hypothetical protein